MLVFLPIIFIFASYLVIKQKFQEDRRVALLVSAVFTGAIITFLTEGLSIFHSFCFNSVVFSWIVLTIFAVAFALPLLKSSILENLWDYKRFNNEERLLLGFIEVTLLISGITAIASTPNSWDSMSYHLARVEHWIQDQTVAYYPTHILRQLYNSPWAEFAIAHLRLLCVWEPVFNLLQWSAMLGSLAGVSLITRQLGASRRGQIIACLVMVTLPMGILQSVSTQTDYVATFWLVCFIFFAQESLRHFRTLYLCSAGLSLGLALLTKGYEYILMAPFLIFLIFATPGLIRKVKTIFIIIICVMALNVGYHQRNMSAFGSLTVAKADLLTSAIDFKVVIGNLLRNWGSEIDTPIQSINNFVPVGLAKLSAWLGVGFYYDPHACANDFFLQDFRKSESYSGNFFHMLLFTLVVLICGVMPQKSKGLGKYVALVCTAGILFCCFIRFQDWVTRFHLPLFVIFCPIVGILMDRLLSRTKNIVLGVLLFLNALPFLFINQLHPWFGIGSIWCHPNNEQYYIGRPIMHQYRGMVQKIKTADCHEIGIVSGPDSWEYPLWVLLKQENSGSHLRIEDVFVRNDSSHLSYPLGSFDPCAVLIMMDRQPLGKILLDKEYGTVERSEFLQMGTRGGMLFKALVNQHILDVVSSTEVLVNQDIDSRKETVRQIAKQDFDKVWNILQLSQYKKIWFDQNPNGFISAVYVHAR